MLINIDFNYEKWYNIYVVEGVIMKWALAQLYKFGKTPFNFTGEYDFHDYIENIDDILDISLIKVEGVGRNIVDNRYSFDLHITGVLTLECARTLDPVLYPIDLHVVEEFDTEDDGEVNLIEKQTIDLKNVIWENVYLEKPMRIFKEGTEEYHNDVHELEKFYNDQDDDK